MKTFTLLAALLYGVAPTVFAAWPDSTYSEVRAYAYNLDGLTHETTIIVDGKLHPTVVNPAGIVLTKSQVERLMAAFFGKHREHPGYTCFMPRHAFVFYNRSKVVASVEVCFNCLGVESHPEGKMYPIDFPALAELCTELKLKAAPGPGFRKWFDDICKQTMSPPNHSLEPTPSAVH